MASKLLILLYVIHSFAKCDNIIKSSLVFVIDDTYSMSNVIDGVKRNVNKIFDTVYNSEMSQIDNFVLVTFNDPENRVRANKTRDRDTFKRALRDIEVYGGGDCPEFCLSGIKRALGESLPQSLIYVFTDASAKDFTKFDEVLSLAQEKSAQISFVLTGRCVYDVDLPDYLVYYRLAKATSGQVFRLWEDPDINKIIDHVREVTKGRLGDLAKAEFPPGKNNRLPYYVDEFTLEVIISVTGIWPLIRVTDPDGAVPPTTDINRNPQFTVVKVETKKPGTYITTIESTSNTSVIVKGRTTIDFQYGFSTTSPRTLVGTVVKPRPDVKSYLLIDLNIVKGGEVKLTKVQLLDTEGKVLKEQPLREIDAKERFYVTEPFEPPKQMFRIMIIGYIVANNKPIKRLAPTAIEPESTRPQIVLEGGKTTYVAREGDPVLKIPCRATGYPKPTITWKVDGRSISSGSKYSIEEDTLIIRSPILNDARTYTCTAANNAGGDTKTLLVVVEARPQIVLEGGKTKYTAREGDRDLRIPCRATGYPKPTITWKVDGKPISSGSKYSIEENALIVRSVVANDANSYTCTATNSLGEDTKTFEAVVEVRPQIVLEGGKTKYTALEGDQVLRIPCRAIGYPKPTITWKVDGKRISSDSKYLIKEDALIVRSPVVNDEHSYTCIATNTLGEDTKTFLGVVEDDITTYDNVHKIFRPKGTTFELKCLLPHTESDTVRWFHDPEIVNNTRPTKSLVLLDTNVSENGNYSCRVSNDNGYAMDTYDVVFGYVPKFKVDQNKFINWDGDGIFDCSFNAEPSATIQWYYEGKPIKYDDEQMKIPGWGQYSCSVSNGFGSVEQHFNVSSTDCLLHKTVDEYGRRPATIVTENRMWLNYETQNNYLVIPQHKKVIISCAGGKLSHLEKLPSLTEVLATCVGEDKFSVDGKIYRYSDLKCNQEVNPSIRRTGEQCLNKDTEMLQVGYEPQKFVEVYQVCMDIKNNLPLYTRLTNINYNRITERLPHWYEYSNLNPRKPSSYTCETSSSCCVGQTQLLNPDDVSFGAPQRSTFVTNLNTVPAWRGCKNRMDWAAIEDQVQDQERIAEWSGASQYIDHGTAVIPRFLWKVVKLSAGDLLAIVYVNEEHPKDSQVLCTNVCPPEGDSWFTSTDKYTYCCELTDFTRAFNIPEDVFKL